MTVDRAMTRRFFLYLLLVIAAVLLLDKERMAIVLVVLLSSALVTEIIGIHVAKGARPGTPVECAADTRWVVTAKGFRRIALGMKGALESAHMGHPDFRVAGRIFATLGYPDAKWGMVALTPEQQETAVREHEALTPVKGTWGEQGATLVRLAAVDEETLGAALTLAWQNAVAKSSTRRSGTKRTRLRR